MQPVREQFYRLKTVIFICIAAGLVGMFGTYGLHQAIGGIPISMLTKDALGYLHAPVYTGILSNVGIMLWSATAAISLFAAIHLHLHQGKPTAKRFLFFSAMLTLFLAIDDGLMLHETILPDYLHLPEIAIYLFYAVIVGSYLTCYFRHMLETDYLLFILALLALGSSVAMDVTLFNSDKETFFEDVAKFFGIVFWLAYYTRTASASISALSQEQDISDT